MNMTKQASDLHSVRDERLKIDRRHFKVIFVFALMVYLGVYSMARLLPVTWRTSHCDIESNTGVIEQARSRASQIASYATMV